LARWRKLVATLLLSRSDGLGKKAADYFICGFWRRFAKRVTALSSLEFVREKWNPVFPKRQTETDSKFPIAL
jgi:hypothetical protein